MKILVADDSPTNLALITAALKVLGHEVVATQNAEDAIVAYINEKPDLIILDVVMQGINGFECAKKIREIECDEWIPIIFLSGSVDDTSIARGIDAGGDDYLTKPFSQITLAAKIKAMQRISIMRKKLYEATCKLSLLSSTDTLTGLYNRLQFNKTIVERIAYAKRHNALLGLLFLDLDNFKFINDHYGHHVGDLLLKEITKRLKACMREYDFISRLGGDEFAIVIFDLKCIEDAASIAQKILDTLSTIYNIGNHSFGISCSVGIACYPFAGIDPETLIRNADIAMYHAKELGRNNYQYFTNELYENYNLKNQLKEALKHALTQNEFALLFEPIFNLKEKQLIGLEILVRWENKKLGSILPDQFLPMLEEIGLTTMFDHWVLKTSCEQVKKLCEGAPEQLKIFVTISPSQFLHKEFATVVNNIMTEYKLEKHSIKLQIELRDNILHSTIPDQVARELDEMGVDLMIKDFGIGNFSLLHLRKFPIKGLKINKSFIADAKNELNDNSIVKSIINLGNELNLDVVAEGIESKYQFQFLIDNDCGKGQGSFLGKPLDLEKIAKYLQDFNKTVL